MIFKQVKAHTINLIFSFRGNYFFSTYGLTRNQTDFLIKKKKLSQMVLDFI
jgi:hypothetical protein